MRGPSLARALVAGQVALLAAALAGPASVAAATVGFTLVAPTVPTVGYSDFTTFRGTYTCVNGGDTPANCPTTIQSNTATFALRPSGGSTFTTVATVTTSFTFTSSAGGCPTTCSIPFQVTWKAGRSGSTVIPPGLYDLRLTNTISVGEPTLLGGLTIVAENTTTTYTGGSGGLGGTSLALGASVVDLDRGLSAGTGIFSPDAQLGGPGMVTFALYDATNTALVVGPVSTNLLASGMTSGSPSLVMPTAGGSFRLRTTYAGNSFYTTSADLDVITVAPSNTPPVLTMPGSPVVAEATSSAGAAVAFAVSATDAEDDPDPAPSCNWASGATFPLGDTTVTCSVTDAGGLDDEDSFVVRVRDTSSPVATVGTVEGAGAEGWYNVASNDGEAGVRVDVTAADLVGVTSLACIDNGADVGPLSPTGDSFVVGDGTHALACTATDGAGNTASAETQVDVDQTAPSIVASTAPAPGPSGWWHAATGAPTVTFTCADTGSGLVSCSAPSALGEGADQAALGTAVDAAGNASSASATGLDVDLTPPTAPTFEVGGLAEGGAYHFGFVPAAPGCSTADDLSGFATCVVSGYSTVVGAHVLTALATDLAGNTSISTLRYEVLPWTLVGFSRPIDMTGLNSLKAGGSVPLKFEVFAGDVELTSADVIVGLEQQQFSCTSDALIGASAPTAEAKGDKGSKPMIDAAGGHFAARWDAPSLAGTCWLVAVRTADGSTLGATFKLR